MKSIHLNGTEPRGTRRNGSGRLDPGRAAEESTKQRFDSLRPVRGYRFIISASVVSTLRPAAALHLTSLLTSRSGDFILKKKKKISRILESAAVEQPCLRSEAMLRDVIAPAAG